MMRFQLISQHRCFILGVCLSLYAQFYNTLPFCVTNGALIGAASSKSSTLAPIHSTRLEAHLECAI